MKILVTGALGYIGSELLYKLSARSDLEIIALDNDTETIKNRYGFFRRFNNIKFINLDINDLNGLKKIEKVDLIIHLAAVVGYVTCDEVPEIARLTNILGTYNITQLGTPVIFMSTGSVYGEIGDLCHEEVELNPKTLYAETKIHGENLIRNIDHVIFRPATAFGLGLKVRHDLLCHTIAKDAVNLNKIKLYQPNARRSFYSVQKIAELCEFTIDNFHLMKNNTFNVGSESGNVSKLEMVNIIKKTVDFDVEIIDMVDRDTRDYNVNYDRLKKVWPGLNENFENELKKVVEYYKAWQTKKQ